MGFGTPDITAKYPPKNEYFDDDASPYPDWNSRSISANDETKEVDVKGYSRKTSYFLSDTDGTLTISVAEPDGGWQTYDSVTITADELKVYPMTGDVEKVKLKFSAGATVTAWYSLIAQVFKVSLQKPIVWGKALEKVLLRDRVIGDLEGSLVCLLPFEEGFGVRVRDYSLFENHGTISGATWVDGKYGKALSFDGLNDYVSVPHNPSLNFGTGNFTLEVWVKLYSLATFQDLMIKTYDWSTAYEFFFSSGLGGRFAMSVYDGTHYPVAYTTTVLETDVWYHLVGTREGDYAKVYLKGNFEADDIDGPLGSPDNIGNFLIGNDIVYPTPLNGATDEVRVYNRALNAQEIKRRFEERRSVYGV